MNKPSPSIPGELPEGPPVNETWLSRLWPLLVGATVGVALRLVFSGKPETGGIFIAMGWSFVYLAPVVVGAATVYVAERRMPRSAGYHFRAGALANLLFVVGTMAVLLEGLICAIVIVPLFMVLGGLAGLLMGVICRKLIWPRTALYSLGALPLVLGALSGAAPPPHTIERMERSVVIAAPPGTVWAQIHAVRDIQPDEVGHAWMYRIGVPLPHSGVTQDTPQGKVRQITMGKSIHFEQVVQDWEENRHVRWTYRFLTPEGSGATRLDIRMDYRVSTDFNWYAKPVAALLFDNFGRVILDLYARRSAAAATAPTGSPPAARAPAAG
ncbi:MAG: SRPBCC domain-containing protein [Variovorax sp.]|nr:MAG: SRPBCC domain-containing protein [Variovorax sp.]